MSDLITIKLILSADRFDASIFKDLLTQENKLVKISKYDYKEPVKNGISESSISDVIDLYNKYEGIIFKGEPKFWFSGSEDMEGFLMLGGEVEVKDIKKEQVESLLQFIEIFSRNNQILYGYICTRDEFDEKHRVLTESSVSWKGVSKWDFLEYAPGLHWYTIIGKELKEAIGSEKFESLEGVKYRTLSDGSIAFHLDQPIKPTDYKIRHADLEKLEGMIGSQYFFSMSKDGFKISHPEPYKQFLLSLEID